MCGGSKEGQVTAVEAVDADGNSTGGKSKAPPMTPKDKEQMEKYDKEFEGKKDSFKNGPISKRSCTDCICCLLFVAAIVGFCGASAYGWQNGNPKLLLLGWDSDGRGCGYSEGVEDYPYLYWPEPPTFDPLKVAEELSFGAVFDMLKYGTCVKECPTAKVEEPV